MQGNKLFVLEGTDGSGKRTQADLLVNRLKAQGRPVQAITFPRYNNPSSLAVRRYLNGDFGPATAIDPRIASTFYALDRHCAAREEVIPWLEAGQIVVTDRYAESNMGHQGSKIADLAERAALIEWLEEFEYGDPPNGLGIPRPDLVILLYMPPHIGQELVGKKESRAYLKAGTTHDGHEGDLGHLQRAAETYLWLADRYKWPIIECAPEGKLLSIQEIHEQVWLCVQQYLNKP
jgi:thymidylate kinase